MIRTLTAANRERALATGTTSQEHAEEARLIDTQFIYSADGVELLEEFGPAHEIIDPATRTVVLARRHTVNTYDQGAPSGGPYHVVTTKTVAARAVGDAREHDVRTTEYKYEAQSNLGWKLRQPTAVLVDPGPGHLKLRTVTRYSATTGLVTETRMPANDAGGDAHATQTIYYTADASAADAACRNKPHWANLVCKIKPAAQPGTPGLPDIPIPTITYTLDGQQKVITEAVGSHTRTLAKSYDAAGRVTDISVSSDVGAAPPAIHQEYDPTSGAISVTSTDSGTVTITRRYDALGRLISYKDADGNTTTTNYDDLGRPISGNDGKGGYAFAYDATAEPRDLVTGTTDSAAGTFGARYDADGRLNTLTYPNGMERRRIYDAAGNLVQLTYVKTTNCTDPCTWLDFQAVPSMHGQQLSHVGTLSTQEYTYDNAGRLTRVQDSPAGGGCTIRAYGYDADSNRTSLNTKPPAADGSCNPGAAGTTEMSTYDAADRVTNTGFVYDGFGRINAVPASITGAAITADYYANDRVQRLTQNGASRAFTLDPLWRPRSTTDTAGSTPTKTYHYGSDADTPLWVGEDSASANWTRSIGILDDLTAVQNSASGVVLQLTNLHGDIVATAGLDPTASAPISTHESTEFGPPRTGASPRYGWLGTALRETDSLTGMILMGSRLYLPKLGRFLQVDPVAGGSANSYDYGHQDPVNNEDTTGTRTWTIAYNYRPHGGYWGHWDTGWRTRFCMPNPKLPYGPDSGCLQARTTGMYRYWARNIKQITLIPGYYYKVSCGIQYFKRNYYHQLYRWKTGWRFPWGTYTTYCCYSGFYLQYNSWYSRVYWTGRC